MKIKTLWLVLIVVFFNATGNLSLAWGMRHLPGTVGLNPVNCTRAMLHPFVALGVGLLILWMLTRIALLSWADLSFVLPLTGLGYVLAAVLGKLFLNETITKAHWLGVLLIFLGMSTVGATKQKTAPNLDDTPIPSRKRKRPQIGTLSVSEGPSGVSQ